MNLPFTSVFQNPGGLLPIYLRSKQTENNSKKPSLAQTNKTQLQSSVGKPERGFLPSLWISHRLLLLTFECGTCGPCLFFSNLPSKTCSMFLTSCCGQLRSLGPTSRFKEEGLAFTIEVCRRVTGSRIPLLLGSLVIELTLYLYNES